MLGSILVASACFLLALLLTAFVVIKIHQGSHPGHAAVALVLCYLVSGIVVLCIPEPIPFAIAIFFVLLPCGGALYSTIRMIRQASKKNEQDRDNDNN